MPNFRVVFSKDDVLIYISHLDLSHTFIRALNRADVELKYSEGFNPHPKLVFALPLSVGMAGENEMLDIGVADESMTAERLREILSAQMPAHITIKEVYEADRKLKDISSARYTIEISKNGICEALKEFFKGEISVLKKTKGGEKTVNISGQIRSMELYESCGKTVICAVLDARADSYLNPELIIRAMKDKGILTDNDPYTVTRREILFDTEKVKGGKA